MLYLLSHLVMSKRGQHITRGCAPTPWSEYVKFLPRPIPVPTMWTEAEQLLLRGTSLEVRWICRLFSGERKDGLWAVDSQRYAPIPKPCNAIG